MYVNTCNREHTILCYANDPKSSYCTKDKQLIPLFMRSLTKFFLKVPPLQVSPGLINLTIHIPLSNSLFQNTKHKSFP